MASGSQQVPQVSQVCSQLRSNVGFPGGWTVSSGLAKGDKGDKHRGHHGRKIAQTQQAKQRAKRCDIPVLS